MHDTPFALTYLALTLLLGVGIGVLIGAAAMRRHFTANRLQLPKAPRQPLFRNRKREQPKHNRRRTDLRVVR